MCVQYWPASNELEETYGGIHIKVIQEEELANFRIRNFRLYKKQNEVVIKPHCLTHKINLFNQQID